MTDRIDEIRARCNAAKVEYQKGNTIDCACLSWAIVLNDIPYLLGEIDRLTAAYDAMLRGLQTRSAQVAALVKELDEYVAIS